MELLVKDGRGHNVKGGEVGGDTALETSEGKGNGEFETS